MLPAGWPREFDLEIQAKCWEDPIATTILSRPAGSHAMPV